MEDGFIIEKLSRVHKIKREHRSTPAENKQFERRYCEKPRSEARRSLTTSSSFERSHHIYTSQDKTIGGEGTMKRYFLQPSHSRSPNF